MTKLILNNKNSLSFPGRNFFTLVFFLACIIYAITSIYSIGYYDPDEHFQIIEFTGRLTGTHTPQELPWEYQSKIRPATQVLLAHGIFSILNGFHINDPYDKMLFLRLLTAIIALLSITFFIKSTHQFILDKNIKAYILITYFLWFLPFINVRYSSETWSGLMMLNAVAISIRSTALTVREIIICGFFLGLSFVFRFQYGIMIFIIPLWEILNKSLSKRNLVTLLVVITSMLLIGIGIDSFFYETPTITFWNYFILFWNYFCFNILPNGASTIETLPWYYYGWYILKYSTFPIGMVIVISISTLIISSQRSLILWIIIGYLIILALNPHKEERFLFPLANFTPFILLIGFQNITRYIKMLTDNYYRACKFSLFVIAILGLINVTALIGMSLKAAGSGNIQVAEYIHQKYNSQPVNLIYCNWSSPYTPSRLPARFYVDTNVKEQKISNLCDLNNSLLMKDKVNLLIAKKLLLTDEYCLSNLMNFHPAILIQSVPAWIESMNKFYLKFKNDDILVLYQIY